MFNGGLLPRSKFHLVFQVYGRICSQQQLHNFYMSVFGSFMQSSFHCGLQHCQKVIVLKLIDSPHILDHQASKWIHWIITILKRQFGHLLQPNAKFGLTPAQRNITKRQFQTRPTKKDILITLPCLQLKRVFVQLVSKKRSAISSNLREIFDEL